MNREPKSKPALGHTTERSAEKPEAVKAWHFVADTLRDGRAVPADGVKLVHPRKPVICESGLHASLRPWDALQYAPGGVLCLVECGGTILHQDDKLVCTERTILARMDAVPLMREFARMQALRGPLRGPLRGKLQGTLRGTLRESNSIRWCSTASRTGCEPRTL